MRVGVDIDGVLADSLPLWVQELNRFFNKNKLVEEVHLYDLTRTFNVSPAEINEFIKLKGRFMMSAPCPMPGAAQYLNLIKRHHLIYIITARKEKYRQETESWLRRHDMVYDELFLTGSYNKAEICLKNKLDVMIEDTLEVGLELNTAGIPVILLDAPYNRRELPESICRSYSWDEIHRTLVTD